MGVLHGAFVEAVADYAVPMTLSVGRLERLLERRGFDPEASVGAFDGDGRLVAFLFNGVGRWRERKAAYDTGTGVVPGYRRRGLSKRLFEEALPALRDRGCSIYVLEVLQENEAARKAYRRVGFEVTRALLCFAGRPPEAAPPPEAAVRPCRLERRLEQAAAFTEIVPSWQNDGDSIHRGATHLEALGAFAGGALVGLGVVEPETGDVPCLVVAPERRRRGIGAALLAALRSHAVATDLRLLNVDEDDVATRGLLHSSGLDPTVSQFEMIRRI